MCIFWEQFAAKHYAIETVKSSGKVYLIMFHRELDAQYAQCVCECRAD